MTEIRPSAKSNLLEFDPYEYDLHDVQSPELFREMYPYSEIPKIAYDHRHVPMNMPENIYITDTSFRDGQDENGSIAKIEKTVMKFSKPSAELTM